MSNKNTNSSMEEVKKSLQPHLSDDDIIKLKDLNKSGKFIKKCCNKYFLSIPVVLGLCFVAYKIGYNKANKKIIDNIVSRQSVAIIDREHGTGTLFLNND